MEASRFKKQIKLFSPTKGGMTSQSILNPAIFGKQVQVSDNFMIVHNTGKYPTREILYRDCDYLDKIRIS